MARKAAFLVAVVMGVLLGFTGVYAQWPHDASPCNQVDQGVATVPDDFSITFGSGPLHAEWGGAYSVTVNARGEVTAERDRPGRKRPGDKGEIERYTIPAEKVKSLYATVLACRFFDLKESYWNPNVRDGDRSFISATARGKTHRVMVYFWKVDRFDTIAGVLEKGTLRPAEKQVLQGAPITAEQAEQIVWTLPEVKALAETIRKGGARPFTRLESTGEKQGDQAHFIYFGEDHATHTVRIATFVVDRETGRVTVYDAVTDQLMSLQEWRSRK